MPRFSKVFVTRDINLINAGEGVQSELSIFCTQKKTYLYFPLEGGVVRSDRRQNGGLLQHPGSVQNSVSGRHQEGVSVLVVSLKC